VTDLSYGLQQPTYLKKELSFLLVSLRVLDSKKHPSFRAFLPSNPISKALKIGLKLNLEVQHCKENLLQYTVDDILDE
jgi:hypothetical protein